ncbi:hypothetical protein ACIQGW_15975 [Lysinibacillus xylanilyticus]|uniref:hypothetical protein n=1 Tax=Lysinibacillus xylanilyticus TaxID=582475 RepID=UPI003824520C
MTIILNNTGNPITREERIKINENWDRIIAGLTSIQFQINVLAGGEEVDEILRRIAEATQNAIDAVRDAETATQKANKATAESLEATTNSKQATFDAIKARQDAEKATADAIAKIEEVNNLIIVTEGLNAESQTKIEEMDGRIAKVDDKLAITDIKLTKVDDALSEMDSTIQTANQTIENANNVISEGKKVIDESVKTTSNAQLLIDESKSVGEFVLSKQYKKNNTVLNNGSTWIALQDTQNNPLPVLPIKENTYWRLVAQRGIDGTGSVVTVNGQSPDIDGNVELVIDNVEVLDDLSSTSTTSAISANKAKELNDRLTVVENMPDASTTKKGLMTTSQVEKLNNIESGANYVEVLNDLNSTSTTSAVSANKAKELHDQVSNLNDKTTLTNANLTTLEANVKAHSDDSINHIRSAVDTGTANAKVITLTPAPLAYQDLMGITFKNAVQNTGAVTINVNALGAKTIVKSNGTALSSGFLKANSIYTVRYNATTGNFILQGEGGSGNAQPSDVRTGKTFTNDDGEKTGTLVAYGVGEMIKARDLVNRDYIQTDQHRPLADGAFVNSEVVTINGVEYAFSYSGKRESSYMTCVETLTGTILWTRNVAYQWQGRIVVYDSKLYIGYYDNNGVIGTGCGLEVMNALTGASLKITKMPTEGGKQLYDVSDICFNSELKEVLAIGNSSGYHFYLYRFNLDGVVIGNSTNLYSQVQNESENPVFIQAKNSFVYVASTKCVYCFNNVWSFYGKTTVFDSRTILGLALNTKDGVTYIERTGYINVLGTFLTVLASKVSVVSSLPSGLVIKGDLLGYATPTDLFTYRITADGLGVAFLTRQPIINGIGDYGDSISKCMGMSENALVAPIYGGKEFPPIFSKTLKVIR